VDTDTKTEVKLFSIYLVERDGTVEAYAIAKGQGCAAALGVQILHNLRQVPGVQVYNVRVVKSSD